MAIIRNAGGETTSVRFYPKQSDGSDVSGESFTLSLVPASAGTLSNFTSGTDANGVYYSADYTSPSAVQSGVTLRATGDTSGDVCNCPLTLQEPASACCPRILSVLTGPAQVGGQLTGSIAAQADNGGNVTFSTDHPDLNISAGGTLSGDLPSDAGIVVMNIDVTDGTRTCRTQLFIDVQPIPDSGAVPCPFISSYSFNELIKGEPLSGVVNAQGDGAVIFESVQLPSGVTLSSGGVFGGVVPNDPFTLSFRVRDDAAACPVSISLQPCDEAADEGECPRLVLVDIPPVVAGEALSGVIEAVSPLGTAVTITANGVPAGVSVASTGTVGGTAPAISDRYEIDLILDDGTVQCDAKAVFYVLPEPDVVAQPARCPRITSHYAPDLIPGEPYQGNVIAEPSQGADIASLVYSWENNAQALGLSIDAGNGQITGMVPVGTMPITNPYPINVRVQDDNGACIHTIAIRFQEACKPAIAGTPGLYAIGGQTLQESFVLQEADDTLTLVSGPDGLSVSQSGVVSFDPPEVATEQRFAFVVEVARGTAVCLYRFEMVVVPSSAASEEQAAVIACFERWRLCSGDPSSTAQNFCEAVERLPELLRTYVYWADRVKQSDPSADVTEYYIWLREQINQSPLTEAHKAALKAYEVWRECGNAGSVAKFESWVGRWASDPGDGWVREMTVWLKCCKKVNDTPYTATPQHPVKIVVPYHTGWQLVMNGEAERAND